MFGVRKAYRELVKSVRGMQQENDQLKAENARLRSELESVGVAAYLYGRGDLLAENAKLRELLQRALTSHDKMCTNRGTCSGCLFFKSKPFAPACPIVSVTRDARELGVEVD